MYYKQESPLPFFCGSNIFFVLKLCSFFFVLFQLIKVQIKLVVLDPDVKPTQIATVRADGTHGGVRGATS